MRIQPLCESEDLGAAIAFARKQYSSLAAGARPSTQLRAYKDLICRFLLKADPADDLVQILTGLRLPQEILFLKNEWDAETIPGGSPFYGPESDPDHFFRIALNGTAMVAVLGGSSKKPVVLTSSNPAVCSVAPVATTYAEVAALTEEALDPPYDSADTCTPAWFTLTVHAYGRTTLTMTQDGNARYLAVSLFGGNFTFGPMPVDGQYFGDAGCIGAPRSRTRVIPAAAKTVVGARGQGASRCHAERRATSAVSAVGAPASKGHKAGSFVCKAGGVASAESRTARGGEHIGKVGAVGRAASAGRAVSLAKPEAVAAAVVIPYATCHNPVDATGYATQVTTNGLAKRGGTLRVEVISVGPNCSVSLLPNSPMVVQFTPSGVAWYGTTYFIFRVAETANGVTSYSSPATCTVQVSAPKTLSLALKGTDKYNAVTISGGAPPFSLHISGNYTGLTFGAAANTAAVIRAPEVSRTWAINGSNGYCTTDGYLRVTDARNITVTALMSNFGIPSCSVAPPAPTEGWVRKWVSPYADIRTYTFWNSILTVGTAKDGCPSISPTNLPLLELVSPDGKYKITGNYFAATYWLNNASDRNKYGRCNKLGVDVANATLGLNFGWASFPYCLYEAQYNDPTESAGLGFYPREIWHLE